MAERAELDPDARQASPAHRSANGGAVEAATPIRPHDVGIARVRGRSMHPRQVLAMQRLAGNRAVLDALGTGRKTGAGEDDETAFASETGKVSEVAGGPMVGMAGAAVNPGEGDAANMAGGPSTLGAETERPLAANGAVAGEVMGATAGPGGQSGGAMAGMGSETGSNFPTSPTGRMAGFAEQTGGMAGMAGGAAAGGGMAGFGEQTGPGGMAGVAMGAAGMASATGPIGVGGAAGLAMGAEAAVARGGSLGAAGTAVAAETAGRQVEAAGSATGETAGGASGGHEVETHAGSEALGGSRAGGAGSSAGAEAATAPHRGGGGAGMGGMTEHAAHGGGGGAGLASEGEASGPGEESASAGGGGGGPELDGPAPHGEPFPDPTVPAAPHAGEINRLGEAPDVDTATTQEPEAEQGEVEEEDPASEIAGHAEAVESAGQDAGDGGVIDAIINQAKAAFRRVAGTVTGAARCVANAVTGMVQTAVRGARTLARGIVDGIVSTARSMKDSVLAGIRSVVGGVMSAARGLVGRIMGAVSGAMSSVKAAVMAAIGRAMRGESLVPAMLQPVVGFLQRVFGDIPGQITSLITRLTQTANGLVDRLIGGIVSLSQRVAAGVASLAATLQAGVATAANAINGLAGRAASIVGELPGVLRSAVSWLVDRLVAAVRAAVRAIEGVINRVIARMSASIQGWVARQTERIVGFINRVRSAVMAAAQFVANLIRAGLARLAAFRDWLVRGATAMLGRVLRAVVEPLKRALMSLLMRRLGPYIQSAMDSARTMFPNGLPSPPAVIAAQAQAASQAASQSEDAILNGLMHPEGDHFSIGFQLGGTVSEGAGISAGGGASLEVVMDYRRGDIGFFLAPAAGVQLNVGDIGETGNATGAMTFGTVGSFGDANKDVLQGWGGWFTNASYGVQAGVAEGGGLAVQSGGVVSVGGSTDFGNIGSITPSGADQHFVPGATVPGPLTPGTPDLHEVVALGEVLFPTQSADPNALGGAGAISSAATTANTFPETHSGSRVTSIDVTGEASRAFRNPGSASSREGANRDLSVRRAEVVRARLEPLVPGISVRGIGAGDSAAARAGKSETDRSPEDQRATMFGAVFKSGTPDQPGQPVQQPGHTEGEPFQINAGVPNPFAAGRSAWGWDTAVTATGLLGAAGKAGVYGGLGVSYSIPIGKTHFDGSTMAIIRIVFGLMKMLGDVTTGSPLGFIRDAIGMGWGVEELITSSLGQAIGDWTIPMPTGIAVA